MAYAVIAKWTAREGEEAAVAAALANLIEPSRAEPGNLAYQVHRDPRDPRIFLIYELYEDEAAYAAHGASEHFRRHGVEGAFERLVAREREFGLTWEGED
ncbi:MAG: putative quinol monooxygenase [Solirubrobacterales bacterium]